MTYTSLSNVEAYLRTTFSASTSPSITTVNEWVTDADTEVNNLTGAVFTSGTYTEYFDMPVASDKVIVSNYPLISVSSIEYNTGTEYSPTWTSFSNSRTIGDIIKFDKYVMGENYVKAVYVAGYTTTPPEVEHLATLLVVKKIINSDDTSNGETESLSIGSISLTSNIGISGISNLDKNIEDYLKRVGRYKTILKVV